GNDLPVRHGLDVQLVLEVRLLGKDFGQHGWQQAIRDGKRGGNAQGPRAPFRNFARTGLELMQAAENVAHFFEKFPALLSERHLWPRTGEQCETELIFEVLQLPADDWLGSVKQPCGCRYATRSVNSCKCFELADFHN